MKNSSSKYRFISLAVVILLIALWELISRSFHSRQILPGPSDTLAALFRIAGSQGFALSVATTLLRGIAGFAFALIAALIVGIPSGLNRSAEAAFRPVLVTLRSTPVIAIILLAIIWFRVDNVPVFIGFLTMFPILAINISQGIRETDPALIQMARLYKVPSHRILSAIYRPSVMPYLFSGISTAAGFGWRSVIIGEVLSQPRYGIGSMMQDAQSYLLVSEVIAWTLIAIIISGLFELFIREVEKKTLKWKS
jgi:NitT/TauT family transport system permease protein